MHDHKERPIIFSSESVRAILEGRKTQTRLAMRTSDGLNEPIFGDFEFERGPFAMLSYKTANGFLAVNCPFIPKQRLWVRETFRLTDFSFIDGDCNASVKYAADLSLGPRKHYLEHGMDEKTGWRSPIHMPRWASRITLEVKDVRCERVGDITEEDAAAEGVTPSKSDYEFSSKKGWFEGKPHVRPFARLWDKLNAKRGFGWDKNAWVFVVSFETVKNA
jgi:hypothetical protein